MTAALRRVAELGEFFTVDRAADRPSYLLADLYAGPSRLDDHIASTGARLGTSERRVAASILFQGLAARLWSPVLALAVLHDVVPTFGPEVVGWHPSVADGRLQMMEVDAVPAGPADAAAVRDLVVEQHLVPLAAAVRARVRLARAILWGNAASALVGSLGVLARARPEAAGDCADLADALLGLPPLAATGRFTAARHWMRASCCLYYRVPGGGLCGDCVLGRART